MVTALQARWEDVIRVVDQASDLKPEDRRDFVWRTCAGDAALRAEVERLLAASERAADFLDQPVDVVAAPVVSWVVQRESQALPPGTRFGTYELQGVLGRGGMATVYLAQDHKHRRTVAVKVFDSEIGAAIGREWFLREIDVAARLHHAHILPLHDSGDASGRLYYVMPHVEGESLRQRLSRKSPLPVAVAQRIVKEVAGALDYAHRQGVVHRDIKPENILFQEGLAILADFGIAGAIDAGVVEAGTGDTVPALGTPAYMSPEQATRGAHVDGRADVYALGCVLYEMLAGSPPFGGPTVEAILAQHGAAPVPPLRTRRPGLPELLERAIARALQKSPADRFVTAGEFAEAIDRAVAAPAPAPSIAQTPRWFFGVAAAGVALTVALGSRMLQQPLPEPSIVNLVAILPFRIANANPELAWLREGLMDLLAIKLAGEGGLRVAEPRAVLGAWGRAGGSLGQEVTSQAARAIARGLGAGRIIDGAVVGFAGRLTLTASLLDTHDGRTTARASVEGPADSLPMLTDRLTAQLLSLAAGTEARRLASISSGSLPAIRAYLAGRAAFRQGRLREAFNAFREATILDSTFALAALELVHASKWVALNGEEAQRGSRLALAGRERLAPGERALLDAWVSPGYTRPEVIQSWRRATIAYPDRADLWYGLGDVYYHEGTLAGLADPFELAGDAFQRGWALDSASGVDSQSHQRAPIFAEPLSHMLEIAQTRGDTASVGRLVRLGLAADSTSAQGWYLRWHRALAGGLAGARSFWADSQRMDPEALPRIHRFSAWTGIAPQDYLLSADLMLRRRALDDPDAVQFERHVLALNGGRPQEAAREMAGNLDAPGVSIGLPVREALYWDGDTSVAAEAVLRMVPSAVQVAPRGAAQQSHLQSLCTLATWRLAHGDVRYAEMATRQLQRAVVAGLALSDSIAVAQYASLCAALLEATRATALRLPNARSALEQADTAVQISYVGQSLGANLVVARAAEAQGNLPFALRAVRRRAGGYGLLPMWYLSTFLREEGRLAAMTGDIAGSVRAYQQYLALRPNPEPAVKLEVDRVRAELARLAGDDAAGSAGAYPRSRATIGRVQAGRREAP